MARNRMEMLLRDLLAYSQVGSLNDRPSKCVECIAVVQ